MKPRAVLCLAVLLVGALASRELLDEDPVSCAGYCCNAWQVYIVVTPAGEAVAFGCRGGLLLQGGSRDPGRTDHPTFIIGTLLQGPTPSECSGTFTEQWEHDEIE